MEEKSSSKNLVNISDEVSARLKSKCSTCEEKIKTQEKNKEYLGNSLKDSENSLRELIAQKKGNA